MNKLSVKPRPLRFSFVSVSLSAGSLAIALLSGGPAAADEPPAENTVSPAIAPIESDFRPDESKATPTEGSWRQKLTARIGYGMVVGDQSFHDARRLEASVGYRLNPQFESGLSIRKFQAIFTETVKFEATGYKEERSYGLESMAIEPYLGYRIADDFSVIASAGLSSSVTTLNSVTTDAPVASTLTTGSTRQAAGCLSYYAGLAYAHRTGSFLFGAELGYGSSSSNQDANLKGLTISSFLSFNP